jgi:amidase
MPDPLGAFCPFHDVFVPGRKGGPLSGSTFGVKDVFDVAGHRNGAGNPDFLQDAQPAERNAPVVQRLLDAGADLVGKTQLDELCFGLEGENVHYGTPLNVNAPGRIPGGSSSGSAAAVAGKLVDFALGTDTGGSVRLPASFCGLYGIRTSHGRVDKTGMVPLAPSIDTVGWFARDAAMLERIGAAVLGEDRVQFTPRRLLKPSDVWALADPATVEALTPVIERLTANLGEPATVKVCPDGIETWQSTLRLLQGIETWRIYGEWVKTRRPKFSPRVAARFEWASTVDPSLEQPARARRQAYREALQRLLGDDALLVVPTGPGIALPVKAQNTDDFRARALAMLSIAGVAGAPQVNLPLATSEGCPLGLSLIGPPGSDRALLGLVTSHFR